MEQDKWVAKAREVALKTLMGTEGLSREVVEQYRKVRERNPDFDEHCGIAAGVALTLFGGQFATSVAFAEAFHQSSYSQLVENVSLVREQLRSGTQAVLEDANLDEDSDGVKDVEELSQRDRVERQLQVFVRNVDPETLQKALSALWMSFLTASAAVKVKFAQVIALGASVGEFIEKPALKYLLPRLRARVDEKYHRWLPTCISYVCRLIGVSIAFRLNRILATISTAIRGGDVLLRNINLLCLKKNMQFLTNGPADEILACCVVGTGIYAQLFGPQNSMIVRLLLFPLSITEQILTLWVAS